jgi:hypothetical protein
MFVCSSKRGVISRQPFIAMQVFQRSSGLDQFLRVVKVKVRFYSLCR